MTRRKALLAIFAVSGVSVLTGVVYKWVYLEKKPDIRFLASNEQFLSELAEIIIPRTDTPGAKDVQVEKTMVNLVQRIYTTRDINSFIDGLKGIESLSKAKFGKKFVRLSSEQKQTVFLQFIDGTVVLKGRVRKAKDKLIGKSFFTILKEVTSISFCTSQLGSTKALEYLKIPVVYSSCISISPAKRAWASK